MWEAGSVNPDHQPGSADEINGRKRKRQKITRVIRAVFIETALARKIRNRKLKRKSSQWDILEPKETTENSSIELNPTTPEPENSELSSPTTSDKTTTTTICLFPDNNEVVSKEKKRGDDAPHFTAYLFPAILLVLIFLGKLCAIFFTSTWLFSVSTLGKGTEVYSFGDDQGGLHLKHYLRGPLSDL